MTQSDLLLLILLMLLADYVYEILMDILEQIKEIEEGEDDEKTVNIDYSK